MHNDFSDGSRQNLLDNILDAIINLHYSWKEVKISTSIGIWKKLIPNLVDDFVGFNISVEEITADVVEIAKELELKVEVVELKLNCCNLMIKV